MKQRLNVAELEPEAYKALVGVEKYLSTVSLDIKLRELIKTRVSQINHCAYCLEMHTKDALKYGETERRLFALPAWKESPLFSDKEKAMLAMVEEITLISHNGVSDETFENAKKHFSDNELAHIIVATGQINLWNRIAVTTHMFFPE